MIDFTWKIGGPAGFGIKTTGDMFSKVMMRGGYHIFDYVEYPSLIRGGHNVTETRVSTKEVFSQNKSVDVLVVLNKESYDLHKAELSETSYVIYDKDQFEIKPEEVAKGVMLVAVPLRQITKDVGATKVMENNVALGASLGLVSADLKLLFKLIEEQFGKKGEEVVLENRKVAEAGYKHVQELTSKLEVPFRLTASQEYIERSFVTGNDAVAFGAIAAGCQMYIAYPMSPSTSILHTLAAAAEKVGMVVRHSEDEIAVINSACGAGYAGARVMIGTSGGGFSLMVEGLGLVALTETPLVIVDAQRPGPATGMPTWTGQGDLRFVLHAHQDDFPRIVLAPGDVEESFELGWKAFNYAEKYQLPVFILLDKYLSESHKSTEAIKTEGVTIDRGKIVDSWDDKKEQYLRYKKTDDGIAPRSVPGTSNALFTANSYEHDEYGYSSEDPQMRIDQVNRRNRKLEVFVKLELPEPKVYGPAEAGLTLVGWGSTKGPVLQAMEDQQANFNYLHLNYLWPFPSAKVKDVLSKAKNTLLIEGNSPAELGGLIRQETGIKIDNRYLKYDGRPFYPEDILERVKK
ncbi:MAG: 2-oxoacid:acceptor oxidoreductase subunit alpha [bacterium]|nr:2-oxoacid:acceptor oxidoreductase subunit alpha [bacterium]